MLQLKSMKILKSSFKNWFDHYLAFNALALRLKCWRVRFMFHDWYKPWLELVFSEKAVRKFHRNHSSHHSEGGGKDYLAMVIDWECARITKPDKPLNARQTMEKYYPHLRDEIEPILNKLKL